jgi:tetratricopeptide (TPR) repeat protein
MNPMIQTYFSSDVARSRYLEAEKLIREGHRTQGLALLNDLAQGGTSCWEVYNALGIASLEDTPEAARPLFEKAMALEPAPGTATRNMAAICREIGDVDQAIALYSRLISVNPQDVEAMMDLRELLSMDGESINSSDQNKPIRATYERRYPSTQTIVDIFGDSWKSNLPGTKKSGSAEMFDDGRPAWLASQIPSGMHFKSILELGPFEGYQTYLLDRLGAREIVSVEGNTINFLKCLCLKELYGLKSRVNLGDIQAYIEHCDRRFDVVFASGILYHMQEPIHFIEHTSRLADHMYIWTHVYDPSIATLRNGQEKHFIPARNREVRIGDRTITLHARSYLVTSYRDNIPMYWEGGQEDITYWLTKGDLFWLIRHYGMEIAAIEGEGDVNGLPCVSFYSRR